MIGWRYKTHFLAYRSGINLFPARSEWLITVGQMAQIFHTEGSMKNFSEEGFPCCFEKQGSQQDQFGLGREMGKVAKN